MKKMFVFFLVALYSYNFSFADEKIGQYYMSFLNASYNIEVSSVENGTFEFYIYAFPAEKYQRIGFSLESTDVAAFKSEFSGIKEKFLEWSKTAKDNNVKDFDKHFDCNFKPITVFFEYGSKWHFSFHVDFNPYFKVTKEGKCLVVVNITNITASDNEFIDSEGFYIAFSSINEINNFLKELDVDKVLNNAKEKENRNDLFK